MTPHVSIIIVALNEAGNLARTLGAIRQMNCSPDDYEMIVVDGGSADSTAAIARQAGARVVVAKGKNIPASRNIGVANATTPIVAFLDADCLVHPEWLNRGLKHFEGGRDLLVGSPAAVPENATWVQRLWADHWRLKALVASEGRTGPEIYRILTTRNLFTTRRVIEAVGGFDEELNTGEDYYFCYRIHAKGFSVKCDLDISVAHIGEPATLREFLQEQMWHASNVASARLVKEGAWRRLNARTFGIYLCLCLWGLVVGLVVGLLGGKWTLAILGAVLFFVAPVGLSLRTALRAGRWSRVPGYIILYLTFGLARVATLWPSFWVTRKRPKKTGAGRNL